MQITKIEIENFKLFKKESFEFHHQFNIVIGVNGSGKTSLLRAIAVALGGWAHAYIKDENNRRPISKEEIRTVYIDNAEDLSKITSIKAYGSALIVDRFGDKKTGTAKWSRLRAEGDDRTKIDGNIQYGGYPKEYSLNFNTLGQDILEYIEKKNTFNLPLIAVYECDRLWVPEELDLESSATTSYSRFDPYKDCFHTGANHKKVGEWLLKHELASIQQQKETPILLSIRNAAKAALEGCSGLKFDFEKSRVMVEFEGGGVTQFSHLSDGQRTMMGLFCDLAMRCSLLNPHLGGEASSETSGVVLIDELDLHLHPKWQRRIIEDLRKIFPKIQFICTTHSPFLIQSLREGKLIRLDTNEEDEYYNRSIEDIVEDIQGVDLPQKSARYLEMMNVAEEYYRKLHELVEGQENQDLDSLKEQLDELTIPYSDDPAFVAQLKVERELSFANKEK